MNPFQMKVIAITISMLFVGGTFYYFLGLEQQPVLNDISEPSSYDILNFGSYEEYNSYLQNGSSSSSPSFELRFEENQFSGGLADADDISKSFNLEVNGDYSSTNIQELGVDEPDIIKTDGEYLYVIANSTVYIILAYPAEDARIMTTISLNENQTPRNLFIKEDNLAIITQEYIYRTYLEIDYKSSSVEDEEIEEKIVSDNYIDYWQDTTTTQVTIFDVSSKDEAIQTNTIQMQGYYSSARLIEDYIYIVTTHYEYEPVLYDEDDELYKPMIKVNSNNQEVALSDIYYIDSPVTSKTQTQITSINISNDKDEIKSEVFMIGTPSIIYVSLEAIYITSVYNSYDYSYLDNILNDFLLPVLPSQANEELDIVESLSLEDYQKSRITEWIIYDYIDDIDESTKNEIAREIVARYERTIIHKINIDNGIVSYSSQGSVPGTINNQFSMSEYNGNLRVATTVNGWIARSYLPSIDSYNNLYVLNEILDIIGSVENIAVDERIYSCRFQDTKCYLVTFKQIDPFFVIDLEDPTNPTVLGELKIPGYSTYLHPYDENHIIGIGMENQTVKINLFDVEDVANPKSIDMYTVEKPDDEYYWMYSTALYEHKAFLFDKEKNLLIMPISTDNIESAYVFNITSDRISLKGIISHENNEGTNTSEIEPYISAYWKSDYRYSIVRAFYISDVIYTMSDAMIQMNDMNSLDEINSINLI